MPTTTSYPFASPIFTASASFTYTWGKGATSPWAIATLANNVGVTNGSPTVTTSSGFNAALAVGQYLQFGNDTASVPYLIDAIGSDTSLTLHTNYAGATNASTTATQYVANAIFPQEVYWHAGMRVTGKSGTLGYMVRTGQTVTISYSTDGSTFTTLGTLTADSRWHTMSIPAFTGSDSTFDLWLRVGNSMSTAVLLNGDQFLTITADATPAVAAVQAMGNAPPGTLTPLGVPQWPGVISAEGFMPYAANGGTVSHAYLVAPDTKIRFTARCSEIWVNMIQNATASWIGWMVDGVLQGANAIGATPPNRSGVAQRAESGVTWWSKMCSGLDSGNDHEYVIECGKPSTRVQAVAVLGSFTAKQPARRGICHIYGDSVMLGPNNSMEGIGHLVAETKNYQCINLGTSGALVQYEPWTTFASIAQQWWTVPSGVSMSPFAFRPDIVICEGGINDATRDVSAFPNELNHTSTNFQAAIQTWLGQLRTAVGPTTPMYYMNIIPQSALTLRTTYNAAIASAITALADPYLTLLDVRKISEGGLLDNGYNTGQGATATCSLSGGVVQNSVSITAGGSGYGTSTVGLAVSFVGGGGSGATGTVTVSSGGAVTAVTVTSGGSGYTATPNIVIGDSIDGIHPTYNGYQKIWTAIGPSIPASPSGAVVVSPFPGQTALLTI